MFIELAEHLCCPEDHEETFCVIAAEEIVERSVVRGTVGCPICHAEYPIRDGVVALFPPGTPVPDQPAGTFAMEAAVVQALLDLSGPGGYVALIGSAGHVAADLAGLCAGVEMIVVDPPKGVVAGSHVSVILGAGRIPLRRATARGIVFGPEVRSAAQLEDVRRVLLPGLRAVTVGAGAPLPGLDTLATDGERWVGTRRQDSGGGSGSGSSGGSR